MSAYQDLQSTVTLSPVTSIAQSDYPTVERVWMFIDLVNSTAWYVSHSQTDAFTLLHSYLKYMSDVVLEHRGEVIKLLGDGLHASFERPEDALLCATVFQHKMLFERVRSNELFPNARVGLSFGPCVRCELCDRIDYYGCSIILAARLAHYGKGNDIIMSEEFRLGPSIKDVLTTVNVKAEVRRIKGFPSPVTAYRLQAKEFPLIRHKLSRENKSKPKQCSSHNL